jgi:NADP-dependent 3-hydroxy acid dehydrogenase YdfG
MESLKDNIIIVTGAAQGLGKAITEILARDQAIVIAADLKAEAIIKTADELKQKNLKIIPLILDVSKADEVDKAVKEIVSKYQRIDAVINNAGIDISKPITDLTIDEWNKVLSVNLSGPFYTTKSVFPIMEEQGGGSIVNIASTAAKRAWDNAAIYHASKWGLLGFSLASHVEGRKRNIKVTTLISGGMRTPFILDRFPDVPLEVLQPPENVANAVKFVLLQPEGTVIPEIMVLPLKETSWP